MTTQKILAQDLQVGDTMAYCGAQYIINDIDPPDCFDIMLFHTTKLVSRGDTIIPISLDFRMTRLTTETVLRVI